MDEDDSDIPIYLEGVLKKYVPLQPVRVPAGQTVRQAVSTLGIPPRQTVAAILNNQICDLDTVLSPGDVLRLVPPIAGG